MFLFATLTKVMQNVEHKYGGASLTRRDGIITNNGTGPFQIQSAVLKVYRVMCLTEMLKRRWSQMCQRWLSSHSLHYFLDRGRGDDFGHCLEELQQRAGEGGLIPNNILRTSFLFHLHGCIINTPLKYAVSLMNTSGLHSLTA